MRWHFRTESIDCHEFIIEVDTSNKTWFKGSAVEINWFDDSKEFWYRSNSSSDLTKERSEARVWFEFLWIWRGCWEGRIYFIDEEFWSSELSVINEVWNKIEPLLKVKMKGMDSDNLIFED